MKTDMWWSYLADYDGLPGSTVVNLALKQYAPLQDHQMLLVTGISYDSLPENSGLPSPAELDSLNHLGEKRLALIKAKTDSVFVGSFTHKNERLDYFYIVSANGMDADLRDFYQKERPNHQFYINIKSDPRWEAYSDFLYPNTATIDYHREELHKLGAL
jgi:hypothetical protein